MNEVNVCDNFLTDQEKNFVWQYCLDCQYTYGETDNGVNIPTGMVHNISESSQIYDLFEKKIQQAVPKITAMKLYRMYINCFAPSENPYFHTDGQTGITFLYYPNQNWNLNDGGETQFYIDGNIYGIVPEPNRLVMFDAAISHRATSFRNNHRFTVAIKYDE